jgi:hypothetical protein
MDGFRKLPFPSHVAYNSTRWWLHKNSFLLARRFIMAHQDPDAATKIVLVNACVLSFVSKPYA